MKVFRRINDIDFGVVTEKACGLLCTPKVAETINGDIYSFVNYLYERGKRYTPMIATWEITNCCNFSCPFCFINTPLKSTKKVQTFSSMKSYIDDLVEEGLLLVYLTGGEVLSVPDFSEIYTYLKSKGVFVVVLSNLSLLNEDHIELFKELPPLRITSSIYGIHSKQFEYVTGKEYSVCKRVFHNILSLKEMGINVTCQMPVTKYTESDFIEIADWCYSNGIRFTFSNELVDSYYGENRNSARIDDNKFEMLRKQIRQIENSKVLESISIKRKFGYKHYLDCISGKHTYAVSFDAHLRPCFNIGESEWVGFDGSISMKKAMAEMKCFIERKKMEVIERCHGCDASNICSECLYTRNKHKDQLEKYIEKRCLENMKRLESFIQ